MLKPSSAPVWVVGHGGMLGRSVVKALTERSIRPAYFDAEFRNWGDVVRFTTRHRPGGIINCAGLIPNKRNWRLAAGSNVIRANAELPHLLAELGLPMVHMSTDCVYSGAALPVRERPDPIDLYGRSKLAGEPLGMPNVIVVRGSFIGLDHGLLRWLLDAEGEIEGWQWATWAGTTVDCMGAALVDLLLDYDGGSIYHVSTAKPTSKAALITHIARELSLPVTIKVVEEPRIIRALVPDYEVPLWEPLETLLSAIKTAKQEATV